MPHKGLNTRLRILPLLLCCWGCGTTASAELPPLRVSPDLIRGGAGGRTAQTPPRVVPVPDRPAAPQPVISAPPPVSPAPVVREEPAPLPPPQAPAIPPRPAGMVTERVEVVPAAEPVPAPPRPAASVTEMVEAVSSPETPPVAAPLPPETRIRLTSEPTVTVSTRPADAPEDERTEVSALQIHGTRTIGLVAEGQAELMRGDVILRADKLTYTETTDEATAEHNVRLTKGTDEISGPFARIVVGERSGTIESPVYRMSRPYPGSDPYGQPRIITGHGWADAIHLEGENQYRLENATWTTCEAPDPDWYIKAGDLALDYDREIGVARGSKLYFKDVSLLWVPWIEFPLVGQRQSGFLPPTIGSSNKVGFDLSQPYYWNIAPNYDATLAPRYMSRRGVQLAGEFRYLGEAYRGTSQVEWLQKDRLTSEKRWLASWQHQHWITPSLYGSFDFNKVSDDDYFEDLSSRVAVTSKVNLLREGRLMYTGGQWWTASALVQRYQTLNTDPEDYVVSPYQRQPQLMLTANRDDLPLGMEVGFLGQYTKFSHTLRDMPEGTRVVLNPSLALPFRRPGYYITPRISLHHTRYSLDQELPGGRDSITRNIPIVSLDAGMTFERDTSWFGNSYVQTLEPRLYYLRAPYRRQIDVPLFDTSRYDFGFAQLFTDNLYTGHDRIADANQLTAAVSSRFLNRETGEERMRILLGQRYYFRDQKVTMNELGMPQVEEARTSRRADILAGFGGSFGVNALNTLWQYNPRDSQLERANINYRYQPGYAKVLNLGYRYTRDVLRDAEVSAQWPFGRGWYGITRLTHSLEDHRLTEAVGGLEYNGGCWVFRVAVHKFATNRKDTTRAIYLQLELNDLASIGSSPVNLIERSVPGYGRITASDSNRLFNRE